MMIQQVSQGAHDYRLDLISLALKGKKVSFDKVLKMIDDMVSLLGQEQLDDDNKKEYCEKLIDKTEDDLKELELAVSDLGKAIADYKESIATLTEEIAGLEDGIKALDKQVAEATEERKESSNLVPTTSCFSWLGILLSVVVVRDFLPYRFVSCFMVCSISMSIWRPC